MKKSLLLTAIAGLFCLPTAVLAQEDGEFSESSEPRERPAEYRPISSVDALTLGKGKVQAMARAAQYCVENEQYDKAIKLSRMAIDQNDDDNEIHQVYAEALEGKLLKQVHRDPALYNQCVKEWLIVLRQETGQAKIANSHGIGIPGMGYLFRDEDSVMPARKHLMKLTGKIPKVWESDSKYLAKVLKPTTESVTGKMVHSDSEAPAQESQQER